MEATESNQPLTNGVFQLTMGIFSEEQMGNAKAINELAQTVKVLSEKTDKIMQQAESVPAIDTKLMAEEIKLGMEKVRYELAQKPQSITRRIQILLFPEQDRILFYKIVYGGSLAFFVLILLLRNFYGFAIHWSDNRKEIELVQAQNERTRKAWNIFYQKGSKRTKGLMDEAYEQGIEEEYKAK